MLPHRHSVFFWQRSCKPCISTHTHKHTYTHTQILGIKISDRDPAQHSLGVPYELTAESCIPGIVNSEFLQIFEEASVWRKPSDDPNELIRNTFIEEERCFHFGPRMVAQRQEVRVKIINPTKVCVCVCVCLCVCVLCICMYVNGCAEAGGPRQDYQSH